MNDQIGFDFASEDRTPTATTVFTAPPGTWNHANFDLDAYRAQMHVAGRNLNTVPDEALGLYSAAVTRALAVLAEIDAADEDAPIGVLLSGVRSLSFKAEPTAIDSFRQFCERHGSESTDCDGLQIKMHKLFSQTCYAMHLDGVGSIVSYSWLAHGTESLRFHTTVAPELFPSHRDDMESLEIPWASWGPEASRLSSDPAGKTTTCMRPFVVDGRLYARGGALYRGALRIGDAWRLGAPEDWAGPHYSYCDLLELWNYGELQRGDMRGLIVQVGAKRYIIERGLEVYDRKGTTAAQADLLAAAESEPRGCNESDFVETEDELDLQAV
ncbi:hypothetical protein [Paraburkholderia sp. J8-2]|uniref:hypothetical protein n=1 Tax=Paraburkholderia sp. J8-2 TaxID=2805440 RepID=UPI002AB74039|nr:hypothetical protein [Paraburkholderia sp. J8-2]